MTPLVSWAEAFVTSSFILLLFMALVMVVCLLYGLANEVPEALLDIGATVGVVGIGAVFFRYVWTP